MKFETKYLIRWGIPGWVFLGFMFLLICIINNISLADLSKLGGIKSIGTIIAVAGVGVPIGYIFHHINFGSYWVQRNVLKVNLNYINNLLKDVEKPVGWTGSRQEDYFFIEYLMQKELSKLDEHSMNYLSERYRHLLTTTHSLGALLHSLFVSIITTIVFSIAELRFDIFLLTIFILFLYISIFKNFKYFSKNTMFFQGSLLNDLIKEKDKIQTKTEEKPDKMSI